MNAPQPLEADALREIDEELSAQLEMSRAKVLSMVSRLSGRPVSVQSWHGIIGGKNNTFVDSIRAQFSDPDDFMAQWLKGLLQRGRTSGAARRLVRFLKRPQLLEYTRTFLMRNFYRNLLERTRAKPSDRLWSVWFGPNPLVWGLVIAPAFRNGVWTNDVSAIRRAHYKYWTIGHVLETGLVAPTQERPIRFPDLDSFMTFYASVLARVSNSLYEKEVARRYAEYLKSSSDATNEPFLIPELRYAGFSATHRYRLDFAILNSHVMEFIGFELSPASTHMSVAALRTRTQLDVNRELSNKWSAEMVKRREYFGTFGITTITFADDDLRDVEECFQLITKHLRERPPIVVSLEEQIRQLHSF